MNAAGCLTADLADAALAYVAEGVPVFPCKASDKTPHVKGGFTAASVDA